MEEPEDPIDLDERPCSRCDRTVSELVAFEVADRKLSAEDVEQWGEPKFLWEVGYIGEPRELTAEDIRTLRPLIDPDFPTPPQETIFACWQCLTEWERRVHLDQCVRCGRPGPMSEEAELADEPDDERFYMNWVEDDRAPIGPAFTCPECLSYAEQVDAAKRTARIMERVEGEGGYERWMDYEIDYLAERERQARELEQAVEPGENDEQSEGDG